ncbi:hypothetical protein C4D60_Mb07t04100 [Musa balbisiana]|uniref:Uncharacterized protein n=1 Tax=Musa balbisiana TaxID=52838 RepID=A0A4S8JCZ5_MUSBA|nr:hypothetical protein C4D60_Mb07t04100 [Musa balbisiana]
MGLQVRMTQPEAEASPPVSLPKIPFVPHEISAGEKVGKREAIGEKKDTECRRVSSQFGCCKLQVQPGDIPGPAPHLSQGSLTATRSKLSGPLLTRG